MEMKVEKVAYFLKTVITMIVDEKYYKGASCHEKVSSTDGKSGIMRYKCVCNVRERRNTLRGNESRNRGICFGELEISTPSAVLMEVSTGKVIYEKAADEQLPPASVTKVMTLLLIFDALEDEKIKLTDTVSVSEYAASMGGSQVFLEPGETQTVDTMIKCIAVASANDACVAMAEHIWGSEEEFVAKMNERAKALGMEHTNFLNCNGLDADGHVTTARDIALMSRELITRYPKIHDYSTIWMENIIHTTKKEQRSLVLRIRIN